jgi:hypothetical protein
MSQYKISKKRLAEIIKEEYQSLQHRKTRRLNEDASDDTFDMVDVIVQALGPQQALEELVQAMERSNAQDLLGYVIRMHDLGSSAMKLKTTTLAHTTAKKMILMKATWISMTEHTKKKSVNAAARVAALTKREKEISDLDAQG